MPTVKEVRELNKQIDALQKQYQEMSQVVIAVNADRLKVLVEVAKLERERYEMRVALHNLIKLCNQFDLNEQQIIKLNGMQQVLNKYARLSDALRD